MAVYGGPEVVTDGLVLCLDAGNPKSYSGSGTVWTDLSGSGNNGTLVNDPTYSSSNNGTFVFDGTNDYVNVAGNYHLFSNLTFDMWFKPTNTIQGGANQVGRLWGKGTNLECRFDGGGNPTGTLVCDLGGTLNLISLQNSWSNTVWYNVVIVLLTNSSAMYVQSKLNATGTRGSITDQTATFQIGKSASNLGSPFPGSISNFKIYNRALSAAEVAQNYAATRGRFGL